MDPPLVMESRKREKGEVERRESRRKKPSSIRTHNLQITRRELYHCATSAALYRIIVAQKPSTTQASRRTEKPLDLFHLS